MQILQKYTSNFSVLDNSILQDSSLSLETRGLYAYMISLPNDWHFSFENLANANNVGLRVIRKCINELQKANLLEIEKTLTNKGASTIYKLYDNGTKPYDRQKENPPLENPPLENPPLENPPLENPMYYKERYSTKKDFLTKKDILKKENKKEKKDFLDFAKEIFEKENPKNLTLEKWLEWIDYKKQRVGARLTTHTIALNLKRLIEFDSLAMEAIDNSITNCWQGLFLPNNSNNSNNSNDSNDSNNSNSDNDSIESLCEKMLFKKVDIYIIQKYEIFKEKNVVLFYGVDRYCRHKRVFEVPLDKKELLKFEIFCKNY